MLYEDFMGKKLGIQKPFASATLDQFENVTFLSERIFEQLDDYSLGELFEGSSSDIDQLFDTVFESTFEVLYGLDGHVKTSQFGYLDKFTKSVERTLQIEDITYFIMTTLPGFDLEWYHIEWGELVKNYKKLCVLASRDGGKSFYFSNAYLIWKMFRYQKLDVNSPFPRRDLALSERGILVTNEMDLSKDFLEILKGSIEESDPLKEVLYPGRSGNWGIQSIRCKNGARLSARSANSAFRGRHPGYLVFDDYLKENVIYSPTQRMKANTAFHAVFMNGLLKDGQCVVVGTPMHEQDTYGDLKTKKNWYVFEYPAIFPDGRLLNPKRYSINDLQEILDDQGSLLFARERLVKPIISESSIFPWRMLQTSIAGMESYTLVSNRESYQQQFPLVVVGVDLAISASVGADFTVYTVWGIDHFGDMWLMYIWRKRGAGWSEQISKLKAINTNFQPDVVCIETNQYQAAFAQNASLMPGINVLEHNTGENKYNFKYGLPGLCVSFEKRKIHFPYGDETSKTAADIILNEFSSIVWADTGGLEGVGAHDDCVMSTWKGFIGAKNYIPLKIH